MPDLVGVVTGLLFGPAAAITTPSAGRVRRVPTTGITPDSGHHHFAHRQTIVIGVTDHPAARNALRWAFDVAILNDALLVAVTAYSFPHAVLFIEGMAYFDIHDAETAARFQQTRVIETELHVDLPNHRIHQLVAYGDPTTALVAESNGADVLVVGRRASRIRHLLTGSVSKRCANRAACPVVIVRSAARAGSTPGLIIGRHITPTETTWDAPDVHDDDRAVHHQRRHPHFEAHRHRQ